MQILEQSGWFFPANPMLPYGINEAKQEHLRKRRAFLRVHSTAKAAREVTQGCVPAQGVRGWSICLKYQENHPPS